MRRSDLVLAVYLPTALLAMGQGLLLATLPFYATELGVSLTMVSVITAAAASGTLVADVPVGAVLHHMGLRRTMLIGSALVVVGTASLALPISPPAIVGFRLLAGVGTAMWGLSRHAFITQVTRSENRGRSIAVFGGINRIGIFAGPAIGGLVAHSASTSVSFLVAGFLGMLAFVAGALFIPADTLEGRSGSGSRHVRWGIVSQTIRNNGGDLAAAGVAQLFAQVIRQGRQLLIPLVGATVLHLNVAQVGLIMTAGAVLDMSMFVPAGFLMDRYGRKFAAVPSFAIMAIGIGMVPLANGFGGLMVASLIIGLGNGLGSGTMMTLGADLAPAGATGEFLGVWRLIGDIGMVLGPLVVGVFATWLGLTGSAIALMVAGMLSSAILLFLVKETRRLPAHGIVHTTTEAGA